jgi:hypothetical protein
LITDHRTSPVGPATSRSRIADSIAAGLDGDLQPLDPTNVSTMEQACNRCVTLGFQTFFPGVGNARMHDLGQIMLM